MENQYKTLADKFKEIKHLIFEESKSKFPSVHSLRQAGENSQNLLKNSQIMDEEFLIWADWQSRYLEIFVVDLTGELDHDYDARNKRYSEKWSVQERKLNGMLSDFNTKFHGKIIE